MLCYLPWREPDEGHHLFCTNLLLKGCTSFHHKWLMFKGFPPKVFLQSHQSLLCPDQSAEMIRNAFPRNVCLLVLCQVCLGCDSIGQLSTWGSSGGILRAAECIVKALFEHNPDFQNIKRTMHWVEMKNWHGWMGSYVMTQKQKPEACPTKYSVVRTWHW